MVVGIVDGVDSQRLECGPGTMVAAVPPSLGFGVGGQSYSNFLPSAVFVIQP